MGKQDLIKLLNRIIRHIGRRNKKISEDGESYEFPPEYLLHRSEGKCYWADQDQMRDSADSLKQILSAHEIQITVVNVVQSPRVIRYEVLVEKNVTELMLKSIADDIAMKMGKSSIRIDMPARGWKTIIEFDNKDKEYGEKLTLGEIIASPEYRKAESAGVLALGCKLDGKAAVETLDSTTHILIGGSDKEEIAACLDSVIISLIYSSRPDELKMIFTDTKELGLTKYNGIPNILIPTITDVEGIAAVLDWAVAEMNRRYRLFEEYNVRSLNAYKSHYSYVQGADGIELLTEIVVVIADLADIMLAASSWTEKTVCWLFREAANAGIHIVVVTQNPSKETITDSLIAEIPVKMALSVSSEEMSRCILSKGGAEALSGTGDILVRKGNGQIERVQGAYISSAEVNDVVEFVKKQKRLQEGRAVI